MRNLSTAAIAQVTSTQLRLALFLDITFRTGTYHAWSGIGNFTFNGNVYVGVGDLGKIGEITEGFDVEARGTSVELSGIDNTLLEDSLNDIGALLPAVLTLGFFDGNLNLVASQLLFTGVVDKPTIKVGTDTSTISVALETRLLLLQRGTQRRWTSVDQALDYPADTGFRMVEALQNAAYKWS